MSSTSRDNDEASKRTFRESIRLPRASEDDMPIETSPLLAAEHGTQDEAPSLLPRPRKLRSARSIMILMLLVIALLSFADQVKESPETRILESVICYRYYEKNDPSRIKLGRHEVGPGAIGGVDEMYCKADDVQDDLATLIGYSNFFDGFPFLLLALPVGWAADRYGRWPFIFLNLIQFALRIIWSQIVTWNWQMFDVRMVWLGSALSILGGGSPIATSLVFTAIADVTPSEQRAAAFLRLGAVNLSAYLLLPPLAAALMRINPWIPYLMATVFNLSGILLCLILPETLDHNDGPDSKTLVVSEEIAATTEPVARGFVGRWYSTVKVNTSFLTKDWRVPALITTFIGHILTADIGRLLLQYCSKRYALTLSKATILLMVRNGVNVLLLFIILPFLARATMLKLGWCTQRKDLNLARISQAVSGVGWLVVALAPSIPIVAIGLVCTALGTGASLLTRSFLTSIIEPHNTGKAYSIISIVDTLGSMFGAPLLAGLFGEGLATGGTWIGLPFFFIALLTGFFAGLLMVVRLRKEEGGVSEGE